MQSASPAQTSHIQMPLPIPHFARLAFLAAGAAWALALSSATAGISYGQGGDKPSPARSVYASAGGPFGQYGLGGSVGTWGLEDFEAKRAMYAYSGWGPDGAVFGYAEAYQQSFLHGDAMRFLLAAGSGSGGGGGGFASSTLAAWLYLDQSTPYWLDRNGGTLAITRENGLDALALAPGWTTASGMFAAGWYHVEVEMNWGSANGFIGIPTPGTFALLSLAGVLTSLRRRPRN